jgi:hypothetical protein
MWNLQLHEMPKEGGDCTYQLTPLHFFLCCDNQMGVGRPWPFGVKETWRNIFCGREGLLVMPFLVLRTNLRRDASLPSSCGHCYVTEMPRVVSSLSMGPALSILVGAHRWRWIILIMWSLATDTTGLVHFLTVHHIGETFSLIPFCFASSFPYKQKYLDLFIEISSFLSYIAEKIWDFEVFWLHL